LYIESVVPINLRNHLSWNLIACGLEIAKESVQELIA